MDEIEVNGKRIKMVIKEVKNITVACDSCREKRRKCDGNSPCAFCHSKNLLCKFSRPKKRGPKKQQNNTPVGNFVITIGPESLENELLDKVEAHNYQCGFFMEFVHMTIPINRLDKLHAPLTTAQKVQSYSALAFASRLYGDHFQAKKYISQARVLAGSIFDSPDPDTISALLMMSNYWQLVLDLPLSYYYGNMAVTLAKLLSPDRLTDRLAAYCQVVFIMASNTTMQQKSYAVTKLANKLQQYSDNDRLRCYGYFLEVSSCLVETFKMNVFAADPEVLPKLFEALDHVHISEEAREEITARLLKADAAQGDTPPGIPLTFIRKIFCPLYKAIVDWRSGHVIESMEQGQLCLIELQKLRDANGLGILAEVPHLSMFASLAKAFYENNCPQLGEKLCETIKEVCKIMEPEYSFLSQRTDKLMEIFRRSPPASSHLPILSSPLYHLSPSYTSDFTPQASNSPFSPFSSRFPSPPPSLLPPTSTPSNTPDPTFHPVSTPIVPSLLEIISDTLPAPNPIFQSLSPQISTFSPYPILQLLSTPAISPPSPLQISPFSPNPIFTPDSNPNLSESLDTMLREFADPLPNTPGIDAQYL